MSAQVLDRAHIQTPFSYELRCYQVHPGPIANQASRFHKIYDGGAQIGTAEPSVPGVFIPKRGRELTVGWLVYGLGRTRLGGQAPLVPTPPSRFNACFLWLALSFASFKDSFSGSLHSAHHWPSFPQLKQWPHLSASLAVLMTAT